MGKRDELVARFRSDLQTKCKVQVDDDLLMKVVKGCGPSIYDADAQTVAASSKDEMERIKKTFLMKRLGLTEADDLDGGIAHAIEAYGRSERNKYRPVFYYLMVKHFGKEAAYG